MKTTRRNLRKLIRETMYSHPSIGTLDSNKPWTHLQAFDSDDEEDQETIRGMGKGDREWSAHGSFLAGEEWDEMQEMTDDMMDVHNNLNPKPKGRRGPYLKTINLYKSAMNSIEYFSKSVINGRSLEGYILDKVKNDEHFIALKDEWMRISGYSDKWLINQSKNQFEKDIAHISFDLLEDPVLVKVMKVLNRKFNDFVGKEYIENYKSLPYHVILNTGNGDPIKAFVLKKIREAFKRTELKKIFDLMK